MGAITPLGKTAEQIVHNLMAGRAFFERSALDDSMVVCPVKDFHIDRYTGKFKNKRYLNRGAELCVSAALAAVRNAGVDAGGLDDAGLFVGAGPHLDISGEFSRIEDGKIDWTGIPALWMLKFLSNTPASVIAQLTGVHGENSTITTACAASLQAIGEAFRRIKTGYLDLALAGGGDSRLSHGGVMAYKKARALYEGMRADLACRPFDSQRNGFVSGEGSAFFMLEELGHARARNADILGEVLGYGASIDGYAMTDPDPKGKQAEKAVRDALAEARISSGVIDAVSAHGTSTLLNDAMEAELLHRIFGARRPPVIAIKSWTGHLSAACGAVETAVGIACMRHGYLPEIRNLMNPCHDSLNFVKTPSALTPDVILFENFGFGGQNAALVVRLWRE